MPSLFAQDMHRVGHRQVRCQTGARPVQTTLSCQPGEEMRCAHATRSGTAAAVAFRSKRLGGPRGRHRGELAVGPQMGAEIALRPPRGLHRLCVAPGADESISFASAAARHRLGVRPRASPAGAARRRMRASLCPPTRHARPRAAEARHTMEIAVRRHEVDGDRVGLAGDRERGRLADLANGSSRWGRAGRGD